MTDIAILTPSRGEPTPEYAYALAHNTPAASVLTIIGKPVDEARNLLTCRVLALEPRPKFVAWIDDDAFWAPATIERLIDDLGRLPPRSMAAAFFGRRSAIAECCAVRILRVGSSTLKAPLGPPSSAPGSAAQLERVSHVGFHFVVHRTDDLLALPTDPFAAHEDPPQFSEDYAFCARWSDAGGKIYVDATLPVWHVGEALINGAFRNVAYSPGFEPAVVIDGILRPAGGSIEPSGRIRSYGAAQDRYRSG